MLHQMKLKQEEFDNIKYHNKIVEVRLNDEKRKKINAGDKIIFYKIPELKDTILVYVEKIYVFPTFKELYYKFPSSYFGYGDLNIEEIINKIYSIYSPEQEEEHGVVAIMFKVKNGKYIP
ncbi:isomerase [Clostridium polyendosporum]|uniref:Isomerase n=1 Tax=Clostridium polyendosporum TaxID=69208 RepID=A0A919VHM1_9CLOT|nr:ASCH domain-containing protein [Clostridium polyendosporum]GIM29836.1 isomerase [Clostridium polyendosporum]